MSEIEFLENNSNSPIISITIGSFDLLSGIRLCYGWSFTKNVDNYVENLETALKISLSSVHRQNVQHFEGIPTTTIDIKSLEWYVTSGLFYRTILSNPTNPSSKKACFYSVNFTFNSLLLRNDFHLKNSLLNLTKRFAEIVKNCLTNNQPLSSLKDQVEKVRHTSTSLIESGIPTSFYLQSNEFKLSHDDLFFYSTLLTSHLQTKMNTIIEASSYSEALKIVSFLINFMFPFQIGQSSIQHLLEPVPGLSLQIVVKQKKNLLEIINEFNGPVTWLKLFDKRKIYQFNLSPKLKSNQSLESFEIFNEKPEKEVKNNVSNWSLVTCQLLLNSQSKTESKVICKEQFDELTRNSLFFLLLENKKNEKEIFRKMMQISEQDERSINVVYQVLQI